MTLEQFTFNFYQRLRQGGLPLTIAEYKALLEALRAGLGIKSKNDFLGICQLLWCKSLEHNEFIAAEFQSYHQYVFVKIINSDKNTVENNGTSDLKSSEPVVAEDAKNDFDQDRRAEKRKEAERDAENRPNGLNPTKEQIEGGRNNFISHNAPVIAYYPSSDSADSSGVGVGTRLYSSNVDYIHSPFILTEEYLPVSLRQMQQSWRRLRHFSSSIENTQSIDWQQTVHNTAQQGFFSTPAYKRVRKNQFQLAILIDHHSSMVPHWEIGKQLIEAAKSEGGYPDAKVYYTHNIPSKYLYRTPFHTDIVSIESMLQECNPRHTVFVFFSDAGASRGLFNAKRVIATKRFVARLSSKVYSMAWLNPMPKARWDNTSAELIKRLMPMFECTESGIDAAMKTLKTGRNARF